CFVALDYPSMPVLPSFPTLRSSDLLLYYLQMALKFFRPFIVLKTLVLLPLAGDYFTGVLFVSAVLFTGMIYGIDFRLRNPGSSLDRKSTRLNSSHVKISYAVFCLKI